MCRILIAILSLQVFIASCPCAQAEQLLNENEQQVLIQIARDTLRWYLNKQQVPALSGYPVSAALQKKCGVFVTLKNKKNGELRGCIGYIDGVKPLREAVRDCSVEAATRDQRFAPLRSGEDQTVQIEISVLTPPRKIATIGDITIGKHGLIISQGMHRGVLLPQVSVEWGWNRADFLAAVCRKAGLPEGAWQEGAELYIFSAQVFRE
jgi:AmmeMemoRadiSam system protein A